MVMILQSLMVNGAMPLDLLAASCAPATERCGRKAADLMGSLRFTLEYPSEGGARAAALPRTERCKRSFSIAENVRKENRVCATLGRSSNSALSPRRIKG
jgi:hypothetical protein